jgi:restriction system protein
MEGPGTMNVRDAIIQILREAGSPLPAREIAKRILDKRLWQTRGKTPGATVAARLYMDIKTNGEGSPFVLVGPQTFGLRELGAKPSQAASRRAVKQATKPLGTEAAGGMTMAAESAAEYSFTDAAEKVLEQFGDKQPLHYRDITKRALELDMLDTEGKTPEATMYAQILTEIRRYQKRGEQPRFVQHGRGYVGLSRWMGRGLAFQIEQHNRQVRQALRKRLLGMDPTEFEELIARLLAEIGFENIEVTQRSKDGGIDVRGTLVVGDVIRTRMAVQVKRWQPKNRVQSQTVQQIRGSLGTHEQGLIITTSDFTAGARTEAARPNAVPVALMNGEQLVALLAGHEVGIKRRTHDLLELAEAADLTAGNQ